MPAVELAIAAIPVAVYFMLIGALRLRSRPLVTTGWRDTFTLGLAASGLIMVGPMKLFFPVAAAQRWHGWVWLALAALYLLSLIMILLSSKPRLVAYGMNDSQFHMTLLSAAQQLDEAASWDGEVLKLPKLHMQLAYDPSGSTRVHQVVHVGMLRDLAVWMQLERAFVLAGRQVECPRSAAGIPFVLCGAVLLGVVVLPLVTQPDVAHAQLLEFLAQ